MNRQKPRKKNLILAFVMIALIFVAGIIAVLFVGKQEGYRTICVFEVSGTVSVVKDGIEYEAYPGMLLQEGHVIVTSCDSYARLVLDDDKYVKLESGSRVTFETLGLMGSGKTKIVLERGAITSELVNPLKAEEEYVVNTPNAVLAVRGTFFRVNLGVTKNGEITTDVYTYGGKVASQRVLPSGEVVDEDVVVDAGYMTSIQMNTEETVYLVGKETDVQRPNTAPINPEDISNEDMVDLYFASLHGHEIFLSTEEIADTLKIRDVIIDEYTPVYDLAEEVSQEEDREIAQIPDDKGDIVVEDKPQQEEVIVQELEEEQGEDEIVAEEPEIDTVPEQIVTIETHVHTEVTSIIEATCIEDGKKIVCCSTCDEVLSETVIPATGHTEDTPVDTVAATCTTEGTRTISCKDCGILLKEESIPLTDHLETTRTRAAGCETEGKETVSCQVCNAILSETTLEATGHTRADTTADVTTCSNAGCGETLVVANSTAVFPDATFRNIVQGYDYNSDGLLSDTERFSVSSFDISSSGVTDVTGLTYFSFITQLYCRDNTNLTSLDTTGMSMLTLVDIQNSGIENLEITSDKNNGNLQALYAQNCSALEMLKLNGTNIAMLYLDNCTELTTLDVTNCASLTGVDVSTCTKLTTFIKTGSGLE